jgi:branched-chain amino acid transport system ATP-binding protein
MDFQVSGLRVVLGGVTAVDDVSFAVSQGEILGLIGPNGAGKTTAVNAISGYLRPTSGRVTLDGSDITGWAPERLVRAGIARTFQGARLFGQLTVLENVRVPALIRRRGRAATRLAEQILEQLGLAGRAGEPAQDQPAGVQRLLGLARALAAEPRLLLLDEPAAGLNDDESAELSQLLRNLARDSDIGVLIIEHDMSLIMGLCDRLHVLNSGRTLFSGAPQDVRRNPEVIEAYLGSTA